MTEHSKRQSRELDQALAGALTGELDGTLAEAAGPHEQAHPDEVALAAYVDGALAPDEQEQLEIHLSQCDVCRELVTVTAVYVADPVTAEGSREKAQARPAAKRPLLGWLSEQLRRFAPPQPLLATAAALALVALAWLVVPRLPHDPAGDFGSFSEGGDVLRGTEEMAPTLISPSFEVVDTTRPSFRAGFPAPVTTGRLLVIDEDEQPVGLVELPLRAEGEDFLIAYPEAWPDLVPGAVYAWKIDVEQDGRWVPSAFAPFRVATDASGP